MNSSTSCGDQPFVPGVAQRLTGFSAHLRYCFYLRLIEATRINERPSQLGSFAVPAEACWVVVPKELEHGWFVVLPLLSSAQVSNERKKGLQATLARISPCIESDASWVLDIPERYPSRLLRDAELTRGRKERECTVQFAELAKDDSKEPYSKVQLRFCYYLHLGEAEKSTESTEDRPVFTVPYKRRWVLVRKYLRDGTAQIHQLTSKDETESGRKKRFHVQLGRVVSNTSEDSWAQCILERYPQRFMDEAERDSNTTRKYCDVMETKSLLTKINANSPDHWVRSQPPESVDE